jgi:hypothetical protein
MEVPVQLDLKINQVSRFSQSLVSDVMFDNYSDNGSFLLTIVKLKLSLKYFQYL